MPKIIVDTNELYSVEEAQSKLGIGYATVFRWIKSGRLQALKLGGRTLIPKTEVERLLTERARAA